MPSSTARTARLRSAAWAAAGNDRVSPSVMPGAYNTITPFACRSDNCSTYGAARAARTRLGTALGRRSMVRMGPLVASRCAGNRLRLAAAVWASARGWEARDGRRQGRSSGRVAARLLPAGDVQGCRRGGGEAFRLVMAHETPGNPLVRALPSPYRARAVVSPGVSCRRARSHAGSGASTRTGSGLWMTLGTSRAQLLTAAGTAVDNPAASWGRLLEREIPLLGPTCSEGRRGPVDRKKLRTWCRHPVRYSGR